VMGDELTEIRFYVPGTINKLKASGSDAGSQKSDNEDEEEISAAQVFHDTVKDRAKIGQVHGDLILSFEEVLVLTPRGRYDMDMFPTFLRLRGKTYDYKIVYQSISRLFLLPKDDQQVLFIASLVFVFKLSTLTFDIAWSQHTNSARSDALSISGYAVLPRGRNYGRVEHD
jgi:structure-specific recognition protein 1